MEGKHDGGAPDLRDPPPPGTAQALEVGPGLECGSVTTAGLKEKGNDPPPFEDPAPDRLSVVPSQGGGIGIWGDALWNQNVPGHLCPAPSARVTLGSGRG